MYADRKGWVLGNVHVYVQVLFGRAAPSGSNGPSVSGKRCTPEQLARLDEIADRTPVTKVVTTGVPIATRVQ